MIETYVVPVASRRSAHESTRRGGNMTTTHTTGFRRKKLRWRQVASISWANIPAPVFRGANDNDHNAQQHACSTRGSIHKSLKHQAHGTRQQVPHKTTIRKLLRRDVRLTLEPINAEHIIHVRSLLACLFDDCVLFWKPIVRVLGGATVPIATARICCCCLDPGCLAFRLPRRTTQLDKQAEVVERLPPQDLTSS